jgi:hypothetical protein
MTTKAIGEQGFRWFFGKVVDRKSDPLKLGRLRVRVYGIHDDEGAQPDDSLPWATVVTSTSSASNQQVGMAPVGVTEGTVVFGFFADGAECQIPVILGTLPGMPENDETLHDVSKLAREINSLEKQMVDGFEPASAYAAQYPFNKVFQSESGHVIEIDDTPSAERLHIYHRTGTYTEIDKEGNRVDKIVGKGFEVVVKDKQVYVGGTCTVDIMGSSIVNIKQNSSLTVDGSTSIYSKGNLDITSDSKITMKAPRIELNPASTGPGGPSIEPPPIPDAPPKHRLAGYVSPNLTTDRYGQ